MLNKIYLLGGKQNKIEAYGIVATRWQQHCDKAIEVSGEPPAQNEILRQRHSCLKQAQKTGNAKTGTEDQQRALEKRLPM